MKWSFFVVALTLVGLEAVACTTYTTSSPVIETPSQSTATSPTVGGADPPAESSTASLVSGSPKPTSTTVATPSPAAVRPQCDPLHFAKERLGAAGVVDDRSGMATLQDLDGDGRVEVAVSYVTSDQDAWQQQPRLMLLSPTGAANCFQVSYDGVGSQVRLRSSKTNEAYDLELAVVYGEGGMMMNLNGEVVLKFDGTRYRWAQVLKCELWLTHQQQSQAQCRSELQNHNPDKK